MKKDQLRQYIAGFVAEGACVAFSGGADSSLILKLAVEEGEKIGREVYAVTFETKLHPGSDVAVSRQVAQEMGARHEVIQLDEFQDEAIMRNPIDRCYLCKKLLFTTLKAYAADKGLKHILDGTNLDDHGTYRPGIKALAELGIVSPLAEKGFTKAEVRAFAQELGISVSQRPSAPCLATRLPYGTAIDGELLQRIDAGEEYLKSLGFAVVRLRVHGDILRIEIPPKDFQAFLDLQGVIIKKLKSLRFVYVTLDLEGFRSGSMDIHLIKAKSTERND